MAELHVQEKQSPMWPWIAAGAVVLALLVWFLMRGAGDLNVGAVNTTDTTRVATPQTGMAAGTIAGSAVSEYLLFVDARSSRDGLAHVYTADGLRQLAAAMTQIAGGDSVGGVALEPRIDAIRERADAMQRNPNSLEHALQVREAFIVASDLFGQMNGHRGSTTADNLAALQSASTAIEPTRPLLDQANQIEDFFAQAGEALRNMTNTTG